jgi:hypothetical protein
MTVYAYSLAAGLMSGEGLGGVLNALFSVAGIGGKKCKSSDLAHKSSSIYVSLIVSISHIPLQMAQALFARGKFIAAKKDTEDKPD